MSTRVYHHITADADVLAGQPVIEGTAIPASLLVEHIASGKTLDVVAREHGISVEAVRAALEYAAQRAAEPVAIDSPVVHGGVRGVGRDGEDLEVTDEANRVGLDPAELSPLGRRLLDLRARRSIAGEPALTSWEELDEEIADRRGGAHADMDL